MNKDREIVKELGGFWHERITSRLCNCGFIPTGFEIIENHISYNNPDFTSDPGKAQLLREMEKRDDWDEFLNKVGLGGGYRRRHSIYIEYILDTTSKLRDAAWEWLCNRKEKL